MWKFLFWFTVVGPVVVGLYILLKWTVLGITWPVRWFFRALWRKVFGKKNPHKDLLEIPEGAGGLFWDWMRERHSAYADVSPPWDTEQQLKAVADAEGGSYKFLCSQVQRIFVTDEDWGIRRGTEEGWIS